MSVTKSDHFLSARAERQKHEARRFWPSDDDDGVEDDDDDGVEDDDDGDDADHLSRSPPWLWRSLLPQLQQPSLFEVVLALGHPSPDDDYGDDDFYIWPS